MATCTEFRSPTLRDAVGWVQAPTKFFREKWNGGFHHP